MKFFTVPVGTLGTNCYILASEQKNAVIIDPGAQAEKIIRLLGENGVAPKKILLTHGHHDHIGAVSALLEKYAGLTVQIGREDLEMLGDTQKSLAEFRCKDASGYVVGAAQPVDDGDAIVLDELSFRVMAAPGHTKGGVVYIIDDMIFSGDTLFRDDVGRCDLYGGSYPVMKRSLAKLCALPGDYSVYPGHGEATTLDYERKNNMYINEPMPAE